MVCSTIKYISQQRPDGDGKQDWQVQGESEMYLPGGAGEQMAEVGRSVKIPRVRGNDVTLERQAAVVKEKKRKREEKEQHGSGLPQGGLGGGAGDALTDNLPQGGLRGAGSYRMDDGSLTRRRKAAQEKATGKRLCAGGLAGDGAAREDLAEERMQRVSDETAGWSVS